MSPDLERLIQLQQLESKIEQAKRTVASHPQRVADADARLAAATLALETVKQRLKDNQEARRAAEKDVALYQGRLSKFKDQQSAVKTNREYQALGHEIETATHDLGAVEEKVLERMVEADGIALEVKAAETELATQKKAIEAEKKALDAELAETEKALNDASAERMRVVAEIEPRLVTLFENVGKQRKGVAISATRDGLCSICHVRLRPMVYQEVRKNDSIIQCDSCQRILYYIPPPPPVPPANIIR
jgi:predicted  nucleic acid-binding Zn-ribbon protein